MKKYFKIEMTCEEGHIADSLRELANAFEEDDWDGDGVYQYEGEFSETEISED